MKFGMQIVEFLASNSDKITGIEPNDHPTEGFLKFTLLDKSTKIFEKWDEEDQGLFACAISNKPWNPSIRGITSLTISAPNAEKLTIVKNEKQSVQINDKPLTEWGNEIPSDKKDFKLFQKKPSQKEPEKTYCGLHKGFLK